MLMLPATKTRPISNLKNCLIPKFLLAPDLKLLLDGFDVGQCRQSGFVAEALNLVGRCRAGELEMILPALAGISEIGIDIGTVKDVAGAVGVDDALGRDRIP